MSGHPCPWTEVILDHAEPWIAKIGKPIHDPFAGEGIRLGRRADRLGQAFTGTERRGELIVDPRVREGDSTDPSTYPMHDFMVVTTPPYTNGMSDHYARLGDVRHTYQQASADVLGYIPAPRLNDMGLLGAVRRGAVPSAKEAEVEYWRIANEVIRNWPDWVIVNVDSETPMLKPTNSWYPLAKYWRELLESFGYEIVHTDKVPTPRQRKGANGQRRSPHEVVFVCQRGGVGDL